MKIDPEKFPLQDLIKSVLDRAMALPEFQRDFVWKPGQIAELLRTVIRKWPAGSFLLMRLEGQTPPFELKSIEGAPKVETGSTKMVILDGQQRMTSLFQALTNRAEEVYYVEILKVLEAGDLDDDHLRFAKKSVFSRNYPTIKKMAEAGVIPVHMIWDDSKFDEWKAYLPEDSIRNQMLKLRQEKLPGLRAYDVPAVVLPGDVDFAAVAKIFETLNKTGTRLDTFDLMVARLFPKGFRLRDKWDEAKNKYPRLEAFRAEGIDVLRLIALREHLAGSTPKVKGVRQSDVLYLPAHVVTSNWEAAVEAFHRAIEFIETNIGAKYEGLVPSWTMALPLADAMWDPGANRAGWKEDLKRWAWITALGNFYAQGANTQAVADAKRLRAWYHDPAKQPESIESFRFDPATLIDVRRRNESVLRGLLCMLVSLDARDWLQADHRIRDEVAPLEIHHIFPEKYLESQKIEDTEALVNFCVILKTTNTSLRNDPPSEVLKRTEVNVSAIESHKISISPLRSNDWPEFKRERQRRLSATIRDFLKIPLIETSE